MDFAKLTQMSRQAVTEAQNIARRQSHNEVDTWHLLAALLAQENGIVPGLLEKMSIGSAPMQLAVERELSRGGETVPGLAKLESHAAVKNSAVELGVDDIDKQTNGL